jgi:hypothetical protein
MVNISKVKGKHFPRRALLNVNVYPQRLTSVKKASSLSFFTPKKELKLSLNGKH